MSKRRTHSPEFKASIAMDKMMAQLVKREIDANQSKFTSLIWPLVTSLDSLCVLTH